MKNIFYTVIALFSLCTVSAQIQTNSVLSNNLGNTNYFLDASLFEGQANLSQGKLLGFPRVDLTQFAFDTSVAEDEVVVSFFDGAVVYNNGTGSTGSDAATQGQVVPVSPGFYYFSNPNGVNNVSVNAGRWLPLGGQSATVKSKTVTVTVPANATTATLALGTGTIAANEVISFLGAKIYDSTGQNLIMTADSAYNKATNLLTTGNGMMYQVLPAGDYKVVVDYK